MIIGSQRRQRDSDIAAKISVIGVAELRKEIDCGRSVVLAMLHQGPGLDMVPYLRSAFPTTAGCHLTRLTGNPDLPALRSIARTHDLKLFEASSGGVRNLVRFAQQQPTIVAIMIDIYSISESAFFVPFFGSWTLCMPGPAYLSEKLSAPIYTCFFEFDRINNCYLVRLNRVPQITSVDETLRKQELLMSTLYGLAESHLSLHPEGWDLWNTLSQRSMPMLDDVNDRE